MCVEIRSINSRLWFMAVRLGKHTDVLDAWRRQHPLQEIEEREAGKGGEVGYEIQAWLYPHALRIRPPLATSVSLYGLSRMQNAFRMHCECASFDLNSCTLCYNIYGTHKIRKYAKNKRNYTRLAGGVASYGGFIASLPQLMRYNYIYVYGSTQYINIFIAL